MPTADLDGISIFYHDEGQGEPLLLIHGFPLSSDLYQPQRAALSRRFRVITPDLRGMGRSDALPGGYSIDVYADDLVALLDHLGIGQAIVGGMSMGGYVLFALLRRHPDRVKGIILLDTKAAADTEEGRAGRYKMAEQARSEGTSAIADAMLPKMLTEQTREQQPELAQFVREMMATTSVEGIVGALESMAARPDSTPLLGSIAVPTLIVVGREDQVTPLAVAQEMQQAIPGAQLVIIDGAAHAANLERPAAVNQAIEEWATEWT
ncbi:MAG TPA: alpha/beta fold hydrolase [Herpetosiphonaceae bacterium]